MTNSQPVLSLHQSHPRTFRENKFVYPVLSRRSKGISLGVNLNPDKVCNFDCIYCQVDRRSEVETRFVELEQLFQELDAMLQFVSSGAIYAEKEFRDVPPDLRRLNDIAFSGDGEPTTYKNFDDIVERTAALKRSHNLDDVKLVLITNASMFHRPAIQRALETLDASNGEIWAKLESGTEEYYLLIERTKIPFQQVLDNIRTAARKRPIVIQSLFMNVHGEGPTAEEIDAYCDRLAEVIAAGGAIKLVQVYTVARQPAESYVQPLTASRVDEIAARVHDHVAVPVEAYYGQAT